MELEEMLSTWNAYDRQLESVWQLNQATLRAVNMQPVTTGVEREARSARWEAILWLAIVIALGGFVAGHIRSPAIAFSAAAADVFSIAMLSVSIRRSIVASTMDFSLPVAAIQHQMEALRLLRIRATQWGLLFGTLLWVPWLAVVVQVVFGADLYASASMAWLVANALFGLSLFPAAIWISKRYNGRLGRAPGMQRLMKDLAGDNLSSAQASLAKLRAFEAE